MKRAVNLKSEESILLNLATKLPKLIEAYGYENTILDKDDYRYSN
jgi:hypothetical protein